MSPLTAGPGRLWGGDMSPLTAIRAGWGAALLIAPGAVLRDLPHQRIDRPARAFARVLGARQLAQAALAGRRRGRASSRGWILTGAAVDATHAATMLALALLRPDRRKLALANVALASAFAAAGVHQARA